MVIENEYTQQKHDLIREFEQGKIDELNYQIKLAELITKERAIIQNHLDNLKIEVSDLKEKIEQKTFKKTIIYKESIELYRNAMELVDEIRALKKDIRENIMKKRGVKYE